MIWVANLQFYCASKTLHVYISALFYTFISLPGFIESNCYLRTNRYTCKIHESTISTYDLSELDLPIRFSHS